MTDLTLSLSVIGPEGFASEQGARSDLLTLWSRVPLSGDDANKQRRQMGIPVWELALPNFRCATALGLSPDCLSNLEVDSSDIPCVILRSAKLPDQLSLSAREEVEDPINSKTIPTVKTSKFTQLQSFYFVLAGFMTVFIFFV